MASVGPVYASDGQHRLALRLEIEPLVPAFEVPLTDHLATISGRQTVSS